MRDWAQQPMDFVICGAQKAGTTALDGYLRQHPQIVMARTKETHFFDHDEHFDDPLARVDFTELHASFDADPLSLVGEATPVSLFWESTPKRLWEYNPDLKLIVLLRNPITRAFSHWQMERSRGAEALDFMAALHAEAARARQIHPQDRIHSYVARGRYVDQILRLWRFFPRCQTLVVRQTDLIDETQPTVDRIAGFLGVRSIEIVDVSETNSQRYERPLNTRELDFLHDALDDEIEKLAKHLDWNLDDWLRFGR